ncbi:hypothetical protein M9Y10_013009 [Tritrichomonas musculus]|uniref:Tetraspanin family protein n=1 Tax=Tritrichomonas musculus TaxID=1915356 RepID=A0ABR2I665_9EUKA
MNKVIVLTRGIVFTVFSFIFNFIPCILSIFALLIFKIFDSCKMSRNYGFLLIAIGLAILLVIQIFFNFKTNKIFLIILAVTYAIDIALYITLTVYVFQRDRIVNDFLGSKLDDPDFEGFAHYFNYKFNCCGFRDSSNCDKEKSCSSIVKSSFDDHKVAFRTLSLLSTLILIIIFGFCIFFIIWEFLYNKQGISNEHDELSEITENQPQNENDPENPEKSTKSEKSKSNLSHSNNDLVVNSKDNTANNKKNKKYVQLNDDSYSESEAHKKIEQEVFFGKPKYDPLEADPFEN